MIIPDISSVQCTAGFCVRYSYMLFLIFPAILFLMWFIPKNFVRFPNKLEQKDYEGARRGLRKGVLWMRTLALLFLIIAVASPFKLTDKTVPGNPRLTILVDNSTSMALFDTNAASTLFAALENQIPVKIRTIATGEESPIGTGILNNLEGGEHLLVVTDGQSHGGKLLGDVMLFSSQINGTISTLTLQPVHTDASVYIEGPPEMIKDNEGSFAITVHVVGESIPYRVKATIDNTLLVLDEEGKGTQTFTVTRTITDAGYHTMTAEISGVNDYFPQNNIYYKSIKVVPRPHILFVADSPSPLSQQLQRLYSVDMRSTIPSSTEMEQYMAVIIDNMHASRILPSFDTLNQFVDNGNGLVVFGGPNAYESGGYKGTLLETLLPVKMGAGEESEKSDVNVVVVIDISAASAEEIPYEKAFALSILDSLNKKNNVGAVAFNSDAYEIAPIKPLEAQEKELRDKISRLAFDGQSMFHFGLQGAYDLLKDVGGSKNVIFISDGYTTYQKLREDTINTARNLNSRGVTIYTVGVGDTKDNFFLDNVARIGGGIYFPVDAQNRLKVLFGEPDPSKEPEYYNSLVLLDTTHFITRDLDIGATISGYNYVVPKPAASLLVTTNKNIPVIVVWRFSLGRVVSIATDDGSRWAGELLNQKNSPLLTKSINWAIGDLSRKKAFDVTIHDTSVNTQTSIDVVAQEPPNEKGLLFAKIDTNFYSADYTPDKTGYFTLLGATGAANYPREYERLGMSQDFLSLVQATGGKAFSPDDVQQIIEFVKAHSKRIRVDSYDLRWPFLLAALVLFLLDIAYRRIRENELMKR
jgi:uncharacterized membrane protein